MSSISNVLMVTSSHLPPPEEGIGVHVWEVSKRLRAGGIRVTIGCRNDARSWSRVNQDGVDVVRVPFLPVYPFHVHVESLFIRRLASSLGSGIDVIHIHSPLALPVVGRTPIVATCHTPLSVDASHAEVLNLRALAMKWYGLTIGAGIERRLFRRARVVAVVNESVRHDLAKLGAKSSKVVYVGNGVDHERFCPDPRGRNSEVGHGRILYAGRLAPRKRPHDLLKAVALLRRRGLDVSLQIAGAGPLADTLHSTAQKLGLSGSAHFLGHIPHSGDELPALYRQADVFVQPSTYEGLPGTLLEAMACGTPVLATDIPAHRAVITHGENGWLVPHSDPRGLANGLAHLLNDAKLRARLGRAARESVEERYTWERVTEAVLSAYEMATTDARSAAG